MNPDSKPVLQRITSFTARVPAPKRLDSAVDRCAVLLLARPLRPQFPRTARSLSVTSITQASELVLKELWSLLAGLAEEPYGAGPASGHVHRADFQPIRARHSF